MKTVILAGGFGTRISEESHLIPKPMVEIGGMPILWHIMKIYSSYGYNDFVICCGYKQHVIKEYFADYFAYLLTHSDGSKSMQLLKKSTPKTYEYFHSLTINGEPLLGGSHAEEVKNY